MTFSIGVLLFGLMVVFIFPSFEKFGWWRVWIFWTLISGGAWVLCYFGFGSPNTEGNHELKPWQIAIVCDIVLYAVFLFCSAIYGIRQLGETIREHKDKTRNTINKVKENVSINSNPLPQKKSYATIADNTPRNNITLANKSEWWNDINAMENAFVWSDEENRILTQAFYGRGRGSAGCGYIELLRDLVLKRLGEY